MLVVVQDAVRFANDLRQFIERVAAVLIQLHVICHRGKTARRVERERGCSGQRDKANRHRNEKFRYGEATARSLSNTHNSAFRFGPHKSSVDASWVCPNWSNSMSP